jgi:hypothetical protein
MKRNILLSFMAIIVGAIAVNNFRLASSNVVFSSISLEKIESTAFGETFTFGGETYNNTDVHGVAGDWTPYTQPCKVEPSNVNNGHQINCKKGNGNCTNTTACTKDTV